MVELQNAPLPVIDALLAATKGMRDPMKPYQIGPGRRTLHTHHKGLDRARYAGATLRKVRARHGVGRPLVVAGMHLGQIDRVAYDQSVSNRATRLLTKKQMEFLCAFVVDCGGDIVRAKAEHGLRGATWKTMVTKLEKEGHLAGTGPGGEYRATRMGRDLAHIIRFGTSQPTGVR